MPTAYRHSERNGTYEAVSQNQEWSEESLPEWALTGGRSCRATRNALPASNVGITGKGGSAACLGSAPCGTLGSVPMAEPVVRPTGCMRHHTTATSIPCHPEPVGRTTSHVIRRRRIRPGCGLWADPSASRQDDRKHGSRTQVALCPSNGRTHSTPLRAGDGSARAARMTLAALPNQVRPYPRDGRLALDRATHIDCGATTTPLTSHAPTAHQPAFCGLSADFLQTRFRKKSDPKTPATTGFSGPQPIFCIFADQKHTPPPPSEAGWVHVPFGGLVLVLAGLVPATSGDHRATTRSALQLRWVAPTSHLLSSTS
jgi:hypothetical protein